MKFKRLFLAFFVSLTILFTQNMITVKAISTSPNVAISTGVACKTLDNLNSNESCGSNGLTNLIRQIVNLLSYIVGLVAVIMIIIAGINFTTSGGDANKVSSAKSTLVYALIGLVLVILAQVIIRVVVHTANSAT